MTDVPPAVAEYAVEELARVRDALTVFTAVLDELAGQADVGAARVVGNGGQLLRGIASDLRRIAQPGG